MIAARCVSLFSSARNRGSTDSLASAVPPNARKATNARPVRIDMNGTCSLVSTGAESGRSAEISLEGAPDAQALFQPFARRRQREAQGEIDNRDQPIDGEGLKGDVGDDRTGLGYLQEPDDRGERRALYHLDREAHGRRDGKAQRLRQDDEAELLAEAQGQAAGGLPLAVRDRLDRTAPDLRQIGAGKQGQA